MKINSSAISMESSRAYQKTSIFFQESSLKRVATDPQNKNDSPASLILSDRGRGIRERMRDQLRGLEDTQTQKTATPDDPLEAAENDGNIKMLKKLIEMLRQLREQSSGITSSSSLGSVKPLCLSILDLTKSSPSGNNVWVREIKASSFTEESEMTTFSTIGIAKTADGREISFHVDLELSRSFMEHTQLISEETVQIMVDPLVINLGNTSAEVTDQKFLFDLNVDGEKENISFVNPGSGFLALDKNSDGQINDGSELFGTKSGDGFKDLSAYDADKNGWIDESDDVFLQLRVWTKDKDGTDKLMNLADANVGAIYLGSVSTNYSLNNSQTNQTNAQIRQTGIYLKETGQAGTIQHVDLAL